MWKNMDADTNVFHQRAGLNFKDEAQGMRMCPCSLNVN